MSDNFQETGAQGEAGQHTATALTTRLTLAEKQIEELNQKRFEFGWTVFMGDMIRFQDFRLRAYVGFGLYYKTILFRGK